MHYQRSLFQPFNTDALLNFIYNFIQPVVLTVVLTSKNGSLFFVCTTSSNCVQRHPFRMICYILQKIFVWYVTNTIRTMLKHLLCLRSQTASLKVHIIAYQTIHLDQEILLKFTRTHYMLLEERRVHWWVVQLCEVQGRGSWEIPSVYHCLLDTEPGLGWSKLLSHMSTGQMPWGDAHLDRIFYSHHKMYEGYFHLKFSGEDVDVCSL